VLITEVGKPAGKKQQVPTIAQETLTLQQLQYRNKMNIK